jgi:choice-of-anchor C domain-containing protein
MFVVRVGAIVLCLAAFAKGELTTLLIIPEETVQDPANLIRNGSFEGRETSLPANIHTLAPGQSDLTGWDIIEKPIDHIGPQRWRAAHGTHCLDMDGGIRQIVSTEPGQAYELSFQMAGNVEVAPPHKKLQVLIDDDPHVFEFDASGHTRTELGWQTQRIQFTAAGTQVVLTFFNAEPNPQSSGVALDHVVLYAIEQPAMTESEEPFEVYLVKQIRGLLQESRGLAAAGRQEEAEQHAEKARYRRGQLEEWLKEQFGE